MKLPLLVSMTWMLLSPQSEAGTYPSLRHHPKHPFCAQDLSDLRLPTTGGPLVPPEGLVERGLRPGLMHVQQDVCRCLPRRRRHQPSVIRVQLHIKPNAGEVRVEYRIDPPWSRTMSRMVECLGEPTLTVEPMRYVTDMVTEDAQEEVLGYPLIVELGEGRAR